MRSPCGDRSFRALRAFQLRYRALLRADRVAARYHARGALALSLARKPESVGSPAEACGQRIMMENWSFRRDNLAVLNMIRRGLFGRMVHCCCAHSHDCVEHWFFDREGRMRWGGEFLVKRNAEPYPTRPSGPVLSWLDINCGDAFDTLSSQVTAPPGINE